MRNIAVVSTTRADYGILYSLIQSLNSDDNVNLQLIVSGAHPSKDFGYTYKQIEEDGFKISFMHELIPNEDNAFGISEVVSEGVRVFSKYFQSHRPDWLVVMGDRYEMYAIALAAYIQGISIAHIHGGEVTQGAIDELFRHSMTKMASLHFTSTEEYRQRVIQLGENPSTVFYVGAPALDGLKSLELLAKDEIAKDVGLDLGQATALVTYHPETKSLVSPQEQIDQLLRAIKESGIQCVFTQANADPAGRTINAAIEKFVAQDVSKYVLVKTLGHKRYFSAMKHVDFLLGNTSSGIIEAASFHRPVVNVGDRQKGRIRSLNVIDVNHDVSRIKKAIDKALSKNFKSECQLIENPYLPKGDKSIAETIKEILTRVSLPKTNAKEFYDIK